MSEALPSVRDVVDTLGGVKIVAGMFGLTEPAVWNWIAADKFPPKTYTAIKRRLGRGFTTSDALWGMAIERDRTELRRSA